MACGCAERRHLLGAAARAIKSGDVDTAAQRVADVGKSAAVDVRRLANSAHARLATLVRR